MVASGGVGGVGVALMVMRLCFVFFVLWFLWWCDSLDVGVGGVGFDGAVFVGVCC